MKTVAQLKEELSKFPDTAQCYAYEGEVTGIVVNSPNSTTQGVIFCSEFDDEDRPTDVFKD